MNIDQLWAEATASAHQTISPQQIITAMTHQSNSELSELTRRIRYQRNYALGFLALFVGLAPFVAGNDLALACLLTVVALYALGAVSLHGGYRRLVRAERTTTTDTRDSLARRLSLVTGTLRLNRIWGMVATPAVLACALLGSAAYRTGDSLTTLLADAGWLRTAVVALLVVLPLAIWLGDRLTQSAFGDLVARLRENLLAIERLGTARDQRASE